MFAGAGLRGTGVRRPRPEPARALDDIREGRSELPGVRTPTNRLSHSSTVRGRSWGLSGIYSHRRATIGSSRDARIAGTDPKTIPTRPVQPQASRTTAGLMSTGHSQ